jgi:hypothetical protein
LVTKTFHNRNRNRLWFTATVCGYHKKPIQNLIFEVICNADFEKQDHGKKRICHNDQNGAIMQHDENLNRKDKPEDIQRSPTHIFRAPITFYFYHK